MTEVSISTPHHQLKSYPATPQGEGPWSGVIVLHDIFGLTDVTRGHADWLAKEGYLAVALDLFSWGGRLRCIRALMADLSAREGAAFDDVDAVRQCWRAARIAPARPGSSASARPADLRSFWRPATAFPQSPQITAPSRTTSMR
jgi:dienelactone hydrolase